MHCLVLGLGNILLSDEGVGVHAVEQLHRTYVLPDTVEVLDGGTSGMDLLGTIAGRDLLIVADAIKAEEPPGTVIRLEDAEVHAFFQTRVSPHQLGLSDLLAALRLTGEAPKHVVLIGMVPECLDLGTELSKVLVPARNKAVRIIAKELLERGYDISAKIDELAEVS